MTLKPIEKNEINFIDITNRGLVSHDNYHFEFIHFFNDLFERYNFLLTNNNDDDGDADGVCELRG